MVILTQIFHSCQTSHGFNRNIIEVMTLPNITKRNSYFSSFLVSNTLYQGHHDRSHKLWNIVSSERYILDIYIYIYIYATGMLLHINGKFTMGKLKSSLCRKVPFLTAPHCLFWGVGQEMKQTYLYLWYPLFQAQCDRYDQQNYSVNGHHHYSGTWN